MTYNIGPNRGFHAGEDIPDARLVKVKADSAMLPPEVELLGEGEGAVFVGSADGHVEAGDFFAVKLRSADGTFEVTAAKPMAIGVTLYAAADGKVTDVATGGAVGTLLERAAADGDIVEALLG